MPESGKVMSELLRNTHWLDREEEGRGIQALRVPENRITGKAQNIDEEDSLAMKGI